LRGDAGRGKIVRQEPVPLSDLQSCNPRLRARAELSPLCRPATEFVGNTRVVGERCGTMPPENTPLLLCAAECLESLLHDEGLIKSAFGLRVKEQPSQTKKLIEGY
jgi:hypothetical protein